MGEICTNSIGAQLKIIRKAPIFYELTSIKQTGMDFAFSENGEHVAQSWDLKSLAIQASFLVYLPIYFLKRRRRRGEGRRRKGKKKKKNTHKGLSLGKRKHVFNDSVLGNHQ